MSNPLPPQGSVFGSALGWIGEQLSGSGGWRRYAPEAAAFYARSDLAALRQRQLEDLRALLIHARDTVPLYRERFAAQGFVPEQLNALEDLARLSPLTRADVRQHGERLRSSTAAPTAQLAPIVTGGTTGEPLRLWQDREAVTRKDALTQVMKRRMGWPAGASSAYLWGASMDLPQGGLGLLKRFKDAWLQRILPRALLLHAGQLDSARLDEYARRLRIFRPQVLQAYPSAADALARHLLERRQRVFVPLVVLTAEPVFADQRARVAQALGANVLSFYGSRECGWIAAECPTHHRLHLNTRGCHLERDEHGALRVTDLLNRAMPLLRYETGDTGELGTEPCPCGDPRPTVERIDGRVADIFRLRSGRRLSSVLADMRPAQQTGLGLLDVQLVQEDWDHLTVNYVAGPEFREPDLAPYLAFLEKLFGGELTVRTQRVERIAPEPNGKVRHGICRIRDGQS